MALHIVSLQVYDISKPEKLAFYICIVSLLQKKQKQVYGISKTEKLAFYIYGI